MKTPEKLKTWVKDFVIKHFNDINWDECEYGDKTYEEIIKEIDDEPDIMVGWILMEVMTWSMKDEEDWNKKLSLEVENVEMEYLIKVDDSYYMRERSENFLMKEVFPKYKQVMYFSDEE